MNNTGTFIPYCSFCIVLVYKYVVRLLFRFWVARLASDGFCGLFGRVFSKFNQTFFSMLDNVYIVFLVWDSKVNCFWHDLYHPYISMLLSGLYLSFCSFNAVPHNAKYLCVLDIWLCRSIFCNENISIPAIKHL
jgi:hypothetical protein